MSQQNVEAAKREREKERRHQLEMNAAQEGREERAMDMHSDILKELTETRALPPSSRDILRNLITSDWVLANLQKEDLHELRWELRLLQKKFFAMHPSQDSIMQGDYRAFVYDDPSENLRALSEREKLAAESFFRTVWLRLTRSFKFRQQEMLQTNIKKTQTEVARPDETQEEGLLGRFR